MSKNSSSYLNFLGVGVKEGTLNKQVLERKKKRKKKDEKVDLLDSRCPTCAPEAPTSVWTKTTAIKGTGH